MRDEKPELEPIQVEAYLELLENRSPREMQGIARLIPPCTVRCNKFEYIVAGVVQRECIQTMAPHSNKPVPTASHFTSFPDDHPITICLHNNYISLEDDDGFAQKGLVRANP